MIINWDHTGLNYVPVSNWTMAEEGSKRVKIVGLDDKRHITAVFGCSMGGDFLPPQIIYRGKTPRCMPSVKFADNWHITYTANHWANEETSLKRFWHLVSLKSRSNFPWVYSILRWSFLIGSRANALPVFYWHWKNKVFLSLYYRLQPLYVSLNKSIP